MTRAAVNKIQILGNRILVSRIEEPKQTGFEAVAPTDSFLYKGMIEAVGTGELNQTDHVPMKAGELVLFAKYSPDTQEVMVGDELMKIISTEDVLAIYAE